ncbi:hypothetical protein [Enterococcus sp. AZ196]|uniref:hypothetical protein n=1 Tax=Enterococcus sp. AZ196 TaxID=2774659 RepID=UPI003D29DBE1
MNDIRQNSSIPFAEEIGLDWIWQNLDFSRTMNFNQIKETQGSTVFKVEPCVFYLSRKAYRKESETYLVLASYF